MAWIILFIIYYTWGWKRANEYDKGSCYKDYNDEVVFMAHFAALIGLGFIPWIMCMKRKYTNKQDKKQEKAKLWTVKIMQQNSLLNKKSGIEKYEGKLCYFLPDQNYYGCLNINISELTYKEIDEAVNVLTNWAEQENMKNARVAAIQSINDMK